MQSGRREEPDNTAPSALEINTQDSSPKQGTVAQSVAFESQSALEINTQDSYPKQGTVAQSVTFEPQPRSSPQKKRSPDNESRKSGRKRMKSSNMAQPIDVGEDG